MWEDLIYFIIYVFIGVFIFLMWGRICFFDIGLLEVYVFFNRNYCLFVKNCLVVFFYIIRVKNWIFIYLLVYVY